MDDSCGLVTLTCPNHRQILVNGLWNHLSSRRGVDVDIRLAGHSIRAHRLILDLFLSVEKLVNRKEAATTTSRAEIRVAADSFLEFLYKGEVTVQEMQLDGLLQLAKELDFQALADAVVSTSRLQLAEPTERRQGRQPNRPKKHNTTSTTKKPKTTPEQRSEPPSKQIQPSTRQTEARTSSRSSPSVTDNNMTDGTNSYESDLSARETVTVSSNSDTKEQSERRRTAANKAKTKRTIGMANAGLCDRAPRSQPVFSCTQCNYTTRAKIGLRVHRAKHDSTITILRCDSCNRPFFSRESLDRHRLSSHAGSSDTPHRCPRCDYQTPKLANFYQHLYSKHQVNARGEPIEAKFKCPECEFVCAIRSKLRIHCEKHSTSKPFRCEQCTFSSKRKGDLVQHVRNIHLDIKRFVCETCGHRSPSLAVLDLHRRTHSGERPFVCGSCDKAFADPAAFARHVRLHGANEKPYICHVCAFPFNRRGNLRAHLKNVHKIQMEPDSGVARARRNWTPRTKQPNRI